jgi:2-keto-4-pentenoate hydratase/2-oxohepta-3-ene-1,7-dioic acid hydratase in catechol pathway
MHLANLEKRAVLVIGEPGAELAVDIAKASSGRFGPDVPGIYRAWDQVTGWAAELDATELVDSVPIDRGHLGAPSPAPRQVFAIGLNYQSHAAESGFASPTDMPPVFTKYVSSFSGPDSEIVLPPGGNVDWDVELVVVLGREASHVDDTEALSYVAGFTVGQDVSERNLKCWDQHRSSDWLSRFPGSLRRGRGWSLPTNSTIPTTWSLAALSTVRKCRKVAPVT